MKKRFNVIIGLLLAAVLISQYSFLIFTYADTKSEAESKKQTLEEEQSIEQEKLDTFEEQKAKTQEYIEIMDAQLTELSAAIYDLTLQSEEKQIEIEKTQKKLETAEVSIKDQYADMKLRIKFLYENGNTEYLDMLFGSENIADFLNRAEYVAKITQYDHNMLTKMQETKETIENAKSKLEEDNNQLLTYKAEHKEKQDKLSELMEQKQTELAKISDDIESTEANISALDIEIQAEEEILANILKIEADRASDGIEPSNKAGSGSFIWPLPAQYKKRTSTFGYRSDPFGSGKTEGHCGDDYSAPSGTPIYAVADGVVDSSGYSGSAGNCVVIYHGNGLSSVYMHASVLIAKAGQTVKQGDVIALVGTTGRSTGPHLHISFRLNGNWVDPKNYIGG